MRDPLPPGWRIVVWPLTALAFVGAAFLIRQWTLSTTVAPRGLLDLEFASTQARVNQIVAAWDFKQARAEAIQVTYLDILFIIFYSTSLSLSSAAAADALQIRHWPLARVGRVLSWAQSGTVGFGGGENVGMLWQLYRAPAVAGPWARITVMCAVVKWALALVGALYSLYGAIAWITSPRG
ncbi:MAG TPA: hypothetical protein VKT80_03370 [Chloroflexota bacterium]|nr:hypothetical protein [Chloroflexota bacterium]